MLRRVMVPLDGSPLADLAVDPAAALAARHGAQLELVTVFQPLGATEVVERADREALAAHLGRWQADVERRWHIRPEVAVIPGGASTAEALADHAARTAADLAVMTTHGRGATGRAWFGSVADQLIRLIGCPVLLVRRTTPESVSRFHRILVPLDGSMAAEAGLRDAETAGGSETELLILRVLVPVITFGPPPVGAGMVLAGGVLDEQRAEADEYVARIVSRLEGEGRRARGSVVIDTSPASAILDAAEEQRPDLIVMAGTVRSGADRFLLGSVIDKVMRQAEVPVLIRRSKRAAEAAGERAP